MKKYKTLPDGYRNLTPTEKLKEGDKCTARSNLSLIVDGRIAGWLPVTKAVIGLTTKQYAEQFGNMMFFARPLKPKQSTSEPLGTQSAKTVEGQ